MKGADGEGRLSFFEEGGGLEEEFSGEEAEGDSEEEIDFRGVGLVEAAEGRPLEEGCPEGPEGAALDDDDGAEEPGPVGWARGRKEGQAGGGEKEGGFRIEDVAEEAAEVRMVGDAVRRGRGGVGG